MTDLSVDQITELLLRVVESDDAHAALGDETELLTMERIVGLASVAGQGSPDKARLAVTLLAELANAADALEEVPEREPPNRTLAARAALGLAPGTQGLPLRGGRGGAGRLAAIALAWDRTEDRLTRDDSQGLRLLLRGLAVELRNRETAFIAEGLYLQQRLRRRPEESALNINWVLQYEEYMRIWAPASGLRWDIKRAIDMHRKDEAARFDELARTSLYFCAKYLFRLYDFEDRRGALIVLPTAVAEDHIAGAVWSVTGTTPFWELHKSLLRKAIAASLEFADFHELLETDERYTTMLGLWVDWLRSCACEDYKGVGDVAVCDVHKVTGACDSYMAIITAEWDLIADFYLKPAPTRAPQIGPHVELHASPRTRREPPA